MKKIAIGQAGGPTAVINATLAGFVDQVMESCELLFVEGGYEGLVKERFLQGDYSINDWVLKHRNVPGACLESGRFPFDQQAIETAVYNLRKHSVDTLVFIGGNGTMEALSKVSKEADRQGFKLQVLGLPKTVDNDLGATDHAPGFSSAAKYIAETTKNMSRDLYSMKNFEQVRVLETMGRNAGWLAAASGVFKEYPEEGPHFIAVPEVSLNKEELLASVRQALHLYGYAIVVVSEGVKWKEESQVEINQVGGRKILGGISKVIGEFLNRELNVNTRAELLGMNQRSSSSSVSPVDALEAYQIGKTGGRWVQEDQNNVMVAVKRKPSNCYTISMTPVNLKDVIKEGERCMPQTFIKNKDAYYTWLMPLLGGDKPSYPPLSKRRVVYCENSN
ncbi:diphosphate--fructose-6-phosphate 1-phosphotransferase [Halobacillus mangrovi]|uniref:diphosphate--fructose-6-phosphate 1-phosphotransferase n=1 Tax=Halobacillus mangrovi TaxID=402384 RepID=UPI003D98AE10